MVAQLAREQVGQTVASPGLLGWAFGPRNLMKNSVRPGRFHDVRGVVFRPCHAS